MRCGVSEDLIYRVPALADPCFMRRVFSIKGSWYDTLCQG